MTTPEPLVPNTYPGGGTQGRQPAAQPYAPAGQPASQGVQGVPQAGVPVQPAYQGMPTGYPNLWVQQPRRSGMRVTGIILLVFAAITLVLSVVVCVGIDFVPGDHGDSGDGLAWLGVMVLLYVAPFGLMLALCSLMLFVAGRRKTR